MNTIVNVTVNGIAMHKPTLNQGEKISTGRKVTFTLNVSGVATYEISVNQGEKVAPPTDYPKISDGTYSIGDYTDGKFVVKAAD